MITFLACLAILIIGYFTYGTYVSKTVGFDDNNQTPAVRLNDGVDFVEMPWYKVFLIQFLNIAGTGPIFGAISGAMFGTTAFLWITFGTIFAGGVHDYLSGVISMKHDGTSVSEIVGIYMGDKMKNIMRVFSVILLVLVGTVFITSPAGLLSSMTGLNKTGWVVAIILYYILATVLPVDKIIGKIYPVFGFALLAMACGLFGAMVIGHINGTMHMPELSLSTLNSVHPQGLSVFPYLFVTIACGAISGFHATQSPMMARCVGKESECKKVFFGAMVVEGIVALIWCGVTIAFFGDAGAIQAGLSQYGGASGVVHEISTGLLGPVGAILAILGVVACPITSGDTAFRSARLTIADAFKINQDKLKSRFILAIPLFVVGALLTTIDFDIIWRYFAWSNQTLATIFLWTGAVYLLKNGKNFWIACLPATPMTYVVISYIIQAKEGLQLSPVLANGCGIVGAVAVFVWFILYVNKYKKQEKEVESK